MSAFIVEDKCMDRVVCAWAFMQRRGWGKLVTAEDRQAFGERCFRLNTKAVNYRYSESGHPPEWKHNENGAAFDESKASLIQATKSVACLLYQCSEGDCDKSALYRELVMLERNLSREIISKLPEWDKADWNEAYGYTHSVS